MPTITKNDVTIEMREYQLAQKRARLANELSQVRERKGGITSEAAFDALLVRECEIEGELAGIDSALMNDREV